MLQYARCVRGRGRQGDSVRSETHEQVHGRREQRGRWRGWYVVRTVALLAVAVGGFSTGVTPTRTASTYANPLPLTGAEGRFESCPDPAVIRGQTAGDSDWYLYCTTDPRDGADRNANGRLNYRPIPTFRSRDLVNWAYVGNAFTELPAWAVVAGGFVAPRAPEVVYFNGRYYLYFTVTRTTVGEGGSAIGVATSTGPTGPWTVSDAPVVESQPARPVPGSPTSPATPVPSNPATTRRWVYDPAVVTDEAGQRYMFYGSYLGGISARKLSADGLRTDPADETPITISDRYEGANVVRRGGFYYLFVSATNCCRGPLTGYATFVGRSENVLGPYRDRDGVGFLDARVGGTPVLTPNGNRWVGPGHNAVFTDVAGQDWMLYHAIDRRDPYIEGFTGFTKRPALLDPLDWPDGWPSVRGGQGASEGPQPAPAAQPGERAAYAPRLGSADEPLGPLVESASDEFAPAPAVRSQWQWVRPPGGRAATLSGGNLNLATQATELSGDTNTAPLLTGSVPAGDYTVETRVRLDVPPTGTGYNFVQAGLIVYGDDDNYVKLSHVAIAGTRQIEFAKEIRPVPQGFPRYGNTVLGPPGDWTWMRITKRTVDGEDRYTAFTSRDGSRWTRGGTWTHALGSGARIGLVAFGGPGFTANFDYVRVYGPPPPSLFR